LVAAHASDLTSKSKLRKLIEIARLLSAVNFWWANDRCGSKLDGGTGELAPRNLSSVFVMPVSHR
jgi:hypothetical protein